MRSSVPSDEKPAASARRAHSTMPARSTSGTAFGSPIPMSMRLLSASEEAGNLLRAAELPDRDREHHAPYQRHDARLDQPGDAPAEPRHARDERFPRRRA